MIEDILPRYQETGTGSKKTFTLPFDPISDTYLKVYLGESLNTDYTVNEREVTFGTAPGKGVRVTFVRLVPLDWQDPSLGSINSESINNICTIIVAKMQSLEEEISRCVKVGITETNDSADVLEQLQNAYDILSSSKNLLESLVAEKTTALTELNNVKTQSVNAINSLASSKESEISDYTETEKAGAKREILETKNSVETDINNFAEPIKNEMVTLRDTTRGYKDSAEGFRNESENFKDRCEELVEQVEAPAWGKIEGNINDQSDLQDALGAKQDTLVSGTNIKTIGGNSLLGSGDIEVGGKTAESIANQNTGASVKDIKVWQGSETMWNNGEATTWHNYETDVVPIPNKYSTNSLEYMYNIVKLGNSFMAISNKGMISTNTIDNIDSWDVISSGNAGILVSGNDCIIRSVGNALFRYTNETGWQEVKRTNSYYTLQYCHDRFFFYAGDSQYTDYYSFDGLTWYELNTSGVLNPSSLNEICYANGVWLQKANTDFGYNYSNDGLTWSKKEFTSSNYSIRIFSSGTKFYLWDNTQYNESYLYESLDGLTWNNTNKIFNGSFSLNYDYYGTYYCNGLFFICDGFRTNYTSDFVNYSIISFGNSIGGFSPVIYDNGKYILSYSGIFHIGEYMVFSYDKKHCYLLDAEPTTSSKVYSDKDVQSSLRITSVSSNSVVLSDGDTYNKNSAGDKFSYRTIGDAHPDYLSFIDNKEVRLGNTTIADNTDTSVFATKTELSQKQDLLVSGTNIKTIGGNSLLGSGDIDVFATKTELNNKADVTTPSIQAPYLKTTYVNGASGYNIWSNGYCEQWGSFSGATTGTINLLKTYKDTNYSLTFANWGGTCHCKKNSSSQIYWHDIQNANSLGISWKTSGYLASGQY